ncbi:MAG: 50S ribosomal protein L25 [Rhodothermales bacterium]|nr:50S ribosomal protein L25 [Rhodothermales bacterium]
MEVITLDAKAREAGKKAAKAARKEGNVPCVLYGRGTEPCTFEVPELSLRDLIYTDEFHTVAVEVDGKSYNCVLKSVDFHPVSDRPIHVDFLMLKEGEHITIPVPIHFSGIPMGVRNGGTRKTFLNKLAIRCMPENLPDHIEIDVTKLKIGESILVRDLKLENIEIKAAMDQTLIAIARPRVIIELDEEGEEGEEGEDGDAAGAEASE